MESWPSLHFQPMQQQLYEVMIYNIGYKIDDVLTNVVLLTVFIQNQKPLNNVQY